MTQRVGRRAYKQFYAPYVEKVWGLPPDTISQTVAKARISTAAPLTTLKKALRPSKPVDAMFLYPAGGMAELVDYLLAGLAVADVPVHFDSPCDASNLAGWEGPVLFSGHLSGIAPGHNLDHRGLYLLHIALPKGSVGSTDTFYLPEAEYWFGRVSQPERFSEDLSHDDADVLCIEIPEGRWGPNEDFMLRIEEIQNQLCQAGIIAQDTSILEIVQTFLPRVYPMYRRGWLDHWYSALSDVAAMNNVLPIGRQGLFLHCNIDQCVHIADEAIGHLRKGGNGSTWAQEVSRFLDLRVRD